MLFTKEYKNCQLAFGIHIEKMWKIFSVMFIICVCQNAQGDDMVEVFKWKQMDYYNRGSSGQQINIRNKGKPSKSCNSTLT